MCRIFSLYLQVEFRHSRPRARWRRTRRGILIVAAAAVETPAEGARGRSDLRRRHEMKHQNAATEHPADFDDRVHAAPARTRKILLVQAP